MNETPNKLLPLAVLLIRSKLTKLEEITFKNQACQLHLACRPHQSEIRDAHFPYNETERFIVLERLVASGIWVIKLANSVWLIRMIVHSCELFSQSKQWHSVSDEVRLFMSALLLSLHWICWRFFTGFYILALVKAFSPWCGPLGFESPLAGQTLLFKFSMWFMYYTLFWMLYTYLSCPCQLIDKFECTFIQAWLQSCLSRSPLSSEERRWRGGNWSGKSYSANCWSVTEDFQSLPQEAIMSRHVSVPLAIMQTASKMKEKEGKKDFNLSDPHI